MASAPETPSESGIVLVYLTVDNEEHATRFLKGCFNKGLIATANLDDGVFERTYLKFGRMVTERSRSNLEMTTTDEKVADLIDYINQNNPTSYDYPVPNAIALPVEHGNDKWIAWVKK